MMTKKGTTHYITGNTYPVRNAIKSLGCRWDAAKKAWHTDDAGIAAQADALVSGQPALNSPPPADLTGDESPESLAARYGRVAVAGAKAVSFSCYGLDKGDNGKPNGSIRVVRGKRYVQVDRTARRYMSRDMLEDFDLFDAKPGGSYQWVGVEIEPTDEERAEDAAKAAAKEARANAPKLWAAAVAAISEVVSERPEWVGQSAPAARLSEAVMPHTGAYPTIWVGEFEVYYHVPGYFACDWDYAAEHRVAPLTDELRDQIAAAIAACREQGLLK